MDTKQPGKIRVTPASRFKKYKDILLCKTAADIKAEAQSTYFSYLWWALEPAMFFSVYYLLFGVILKSKAPDFIAFLLVGLITWRWFLSSVNGAISAIKSESSLMQQVYISKLIFPLTFVLGQAYRFIFVFLLLLITMCAFKHWPNIYWLTLPLLLLAQLFLIIGLANCFAGITPFFPDLPKIIKNFTRVGLFMSGIFFDVSQVQGTLGTVLRLNPMADMIISYRNVLIYKTPPEWEGIAWVLFLGVIFNIIGFWIITKNERIYPKACL